MDEQLLRIFIRYFRKGETVSVGEGEIKVKHDLEYIRIQWAISKPVEALTQYIAENRHEAQPTVERRRIETSGTIRGRLDAARTVSRQRITGDASQSVSYQSKRSFSDGPNYVLGWVLQFCHHVLWQNEDMIKGSAEFNPRINRIASNLKAIRQERGIGEAIRSVSLRQRPSFKSIVQAGKSRKQIYRKAFVAYQLLREIENGNAQKIRGLLAGSLLGPLEQWQKFELLMAFRLAEAMSAKSGDELILRPIVAGSARPILTFGPYDVYWQNRTPYQSFPAREPSELRVSEILQSYNIAAGSDRPDVIICNRVTKAVVAVAEAKYTTSVSGIWQDSFREAATQLVRYSRFYVNGIQQDRLLRQSIIAISNLPDIESAKQKPLDAPIAISLNDLTNNRLSEWVDRVIPSPGSVSETASFLLRPSSV